MAQLPSTSAHRQADHAVESLFVARWSPRAMSGAPVSAGELNRLFEAARWAPSSFNEQPWRFLYARRDTAHWPMFFDLLMDANKVWCVHAGALLVILAKKTFTRNSSPNKVHVFDAGAAWENLALQGAKMDLVIHGMAGFDYDQACVALNVPDDFAVAAMAAIGRPGDPDQLPEKLRAMEIPSGRKPIAAIAFEGGFPKRV